MEVIHMEENIAYVENIIFMNKQNISWSDVERYLKRYIGESYQVIETGDVINIASDFPDEYAKSQYSQNLYGNLAKAKANASQVVGKMIVLATNRRWVQNKDKKHNKDAENGWYRYDSFFAMPVQGSEEKEKYINIYRATLVVRNSLKGLFLYDIINIKKEARTPLKS